MSRFVGNMTWPRFLIGGMALLVVTLAAGLALTAWFSLDGPGAVIGACGVLYLVAATGRPAIVYSIVRNMGWFADVQDDRAMRLLLLLLGLICIGSVPLFLHLPAAAG